MCLSAIYWAGISRIYISASRSDAADAGFDDQFLYDEIVKPFRDRRIPVKVLVPDEGKEPFADWKEYDQRVEY